MKGLDKAREGADVDEILEEVVAARRAGTDPKELFGGPRDWVDGAVPPISFLIAHRVSGELRAAVYVALGAAGVMVLIRLVRRETLRHAFSGVFGVVIAALFAMRTGRAENFFLPGIIINVVYGFGFLLSAMFGHPLVGVIMRVVWERPKEFHEHPTVKRAYVEATIGWALVFLVRAIVQELLRRAGLLGALTITKIAMGWPLYLAALALTLPYVKWRTRGVPVPEAADEAEAEGDDAAEGVAGRGEA